MKPFMSMYHSVRGSNVSREQVVSLLTTFKRNRHTIPSGHGDKLKFVGNRLNSILATDMEDFQVACAKNMPKVRRTLLKLAELKPVDNPKKEEDTEDVSYDDLANSKEQRLQNDEFESQLEAYKDNLKVIKPLPKAGFMAYHLPLLVIRTGGNDNRLKDAGIPVNKLDGWYTVFEDQKVIHMTFAIADDTKHKAKIIKSFSLGSTKYADVLDGETFTQAGYPGCFVWLMPERKLNKIMPFSVEKVSFPIARAAPARGEKPLPEKRSWQTIIDTRSANIKKAIAPQRKLRERYDKKLDKLTKPLYDKIEAIEAEKSKDKLNGEYDLAEARKLFRELSAKYSQFKIDIEALKKQASKVGANRKVEIEMEINGLVKQREGLKARTELLATFIDKQRRKIGKIEDQITKESKDIEIMVSK